MKGFGRNVKYLSGILLNMQMVVYLILILVFAILCLRVENPLTKFMEEMPFYLLLVTFMLILISAVFAEYYCYTMVFLGSTRKTAAVGILISIHAFGILQMVILFGLAILAGNNASTQVIRLCPLGTIALLLLIMGVGLLLVSLSLRGHKVCVGIMVFVLTFVAIGLLAEISTKFAIGTNMDLLTSCNSLWLLLVGLAVDLVGAFLYYKTVTKVDLKLA